VRSEWELLEINCLRQLRVVFPSPVAFPSSVFFPPTVAFPSSVLFPPPVAVCRLKRLRSLEIRSKEAERSTVTAGAGPAGAWKLFSYSSRVLKLLDISSEKVLF
jgi:hypothetical protein